MANTARRFVVVGAGGTGGWLIKGLTHLCQYEFPKSVLIIVDGDNFEPKNAERQEFVGYGNKAEVRVEEEQPRFPDVLMVPDPRWVVEQADESKPDQVAAKDLLQENDVVFSAVDNFAAQAAILNAAKMFDNIDVFIGGNDDRYAGQTYHYIRRDGQDVTEHLSELQPQLKNPPDRNPGELGCEERAKLEGGTQLLATNMAVASLLLIRAHIALVGKKNEDDRPDEIFFDYESGVALGYEHRVAASETSAV